MVIFRLLFLFACVGVSAQIGGNQAYQFLNMPSSTTQAALGGNNVTIFNGNSSQPLFNPASLNAEMSNELNVNYINLYESTHSGMVSYAKKLKNNRNVHIGVQYLNYGQMDGYDENGMSTGTFSANDVAVSLGYSYPIENTGIHIGSNLKFISSTIESYSSLAAAVDLGALYVHPTSGFHVGLAVRNVGVQLRSFQDTEEQLPLNIALGFSKQLENVPIRWHLTLDQLQRPKIAFSNPNRDEVGLDGSVKQENVSIAQHALRHVIVGAELFTNKKFNLRISYNFRRGEELRVVEHRSLAGFAAGFSLQTRRLRFEYTHSRMTLAGNAHLIGCAIKL